MFPTCRKPVNRKQLCSVCSPVAPPVTVGTVPKHWNPFTEKQMRKLLVLFVLLAACGGDKTTDPTQVNFAGTFTLRTVNGSGLPYVVAQSGQNSVTINSDQLTIADGGTWSEVGTFTVKTNGQNATQTATDQGTWFRSGTSLTLNSTASKSTAYGGTFTNSQLNLLDGSVNTYVFTK